MTSGILQITIRTGLVTAGLILLYELSNLLLVYHYFRYEYYIAGAVLLALATGIVLANRYHKHLALAQSDHDPLETLTAKELRVLTLIAEGRSNKEIAALNYTEMSTVKTHINNIFSKLGVKSRRDAAIIYEKQKSTFSPPGIS